MQEKKYLDVLINKPNTYNKKKFWLRELRGYVIVISGIIGLFFLIIFAVALSKLERLPTEISIAQIEQNGFPDAKYLTINDAYLVFSEANINHKKDESELNNIYIPAISQALLETKQKESLQNNPVSPVLSSLFVQFTKTQIDKLWPNDKPFDKQNGGSKNQYLKMKITGETGLLKQRFLGKGHASSKVNNQFDWEKSGYLLYGVQQNGLEKVIKNFIYTFFFLTLAIYLNIKRVKFNRYTEQNTPKVNYDIIMQDGEELINTWSPKLISPNISNGDREKYIGRLSMTNQRLIYKATLKYGSASSYLNPTYEDYHPIYINYENIKSVSIDKMFFIKRFVIELTDSDERLVFDYGILSVDKIVDAIKKQMHAAYGESQD